MYSPSSNYIYCIVNITVENTCVFVFAFACDGILFINGIDKMDSEYSPTICTSIYMHHVNGLWLIGSVCLSYRDYIKH